MKKRFPKIGLWLSVLLFAMFLSVSASASVSTVEFDGTLDYTMANEVLTLLNKKRQELGLNTLVTNSTVQELAMERAKEIALYYSHTRPDDTDWSTILDKSYDWYGENIALGQESAAEVMTAWTNSAGHYANMIDTEYNQVGIGCFKQGNMITWVQTFTSDTTSGSVPTGQKSTKAYVNVESGNLSLYCGISGTSFSKGDLAEVPVGQTVSLEVRNYNQGVDDNNRPINWPLTVYATSFAYRDVAAYQEYYTFVFTGKEIEVTGLKENGSATMPITLSSGYYNWGTNIKVYHKHTLGAAATCTTDQICTDCKQVIVGATGHSWSGWTLSKEATVFNAKPIKIPAPAAD